MSPDSGDELLCIVFTDLVGWTALGERVGDDAADAVRREHFAAVRAALDAHRGREVKTAGDSVMATFRSALDALRCAVAIQDSARASSVQVRIGVHAGEPIADENDVFGTAVNIASRLCAAAAAGEVLLSDLTRSLLERERFSLGYILDTLSTRDPWTHRLDICRATGRTMVLSPEHDGRLIADAVVEWAKRHGQPFTLTLTGPAGGSWHSGSGGERLELDALDFCWTLSRRARGEGLLATPVPF